MTNTCGTLYTIDELTPKAQDAAFANWLSRNDLVSQEIDYMCGPLYEDLSIFGEAVGYALWWDGLRTRYDDGTRFTRRFPTMDHYQTFNYDPCCGSWEEIADLWDADAQAISDTLSRGGDASPMIRAALDRVCQFFDVEFRRVEESVVTEDYFDGICINYIYTSDGEIC